MHGHQIPIGPFGKTGRSGPAWTVALAFLCMACWFVPSAAAQRVPSNDLDPTFGIEGVVLTDLPTHDEAVMDVALQADGRILAMGSAGGSFILVRYRSGGGLDTSFDVTKHPFGVAMAVQPDQKIVIAGTVGDFTNARFGLDRLNADGTVDSTFGQGGRVTTKLPFAARLEDVAVQEDGKIVAAGEVTGNDEPGFAFARYLPDGGLDPSFGSQGTAVIRLSPDFHNLAQVAIQPDGKIVANGDLSVSPAPTPLCLVRLEAEGSLDPTFGDGGVVIMTENNSFTTSSLALQPDGKLVSGGEYFNAVRDEEEFGVVRHLPDGTLDLSFGEHGLAHTFLGGLASVPEGLAIQSNGLIVQTGWSPDEGDENEVDIVWWEPDGRVHSTVFRDLFGFTSFSNAVAVQPDGKAIVVGEGGTTFDQARFGLARFLAN